MAFLQNMGSNWASVNKVGLVLLAFGVAAVWLSRQISELRIFNGKKDARIYIRFVGLLLAMVGTIVAMYW